MTQLATSAPARPRRRGLVERARRRQQAFRIAVLTLTTVALLVPLVSLFEFSIRFPLTGEVSFDAWKRVFAGNTGEYSTLDVLWSGLTNSLIMCALTVAIMLVLLVPTMVWVRLKVPAMDRAVEFICLLPLTIPAVVLVVGLAPIYRFLASTPLGSNTVWLAFAYVVLVLPFAYRSIDAGLRSIDLKTLTEAARSFGASWPVIIVRVILPNIRTALISASFVTIAVVLGEFTVARFLARDNLQTALFQINLSDGQIAAVMSLLALGVTTILLIALDLLAGRRERTTRKARP
ncbi:MULTISPECIES: ABC transporter permease [unclassified Pseudoclavibacter]|uniref:ABC transporter permease n=1 Tax=unclassified Pseudoclavibacter TaxID=2615177 RepID=UPI000CE82622|nr:MULTISPECIES: ABC transporter permease subunit [unclassified Pseudoclavibacter]PPF78128.1 ABC transporter permease [Pseudoclavibacter sp. Z016]PPG05607.1 ABC transporter permease [Pseudoclavibacter sp. RFBI5]